MRGASDELPVVGELDPYRLKATPSEFGERRTYGIDDPYVARTHADVDDRVGDALGEDRLVLLIGPSKAGKTRTLFEAVRRELPTARVVVPEPRTLADLPKCEEYRNHPDTVVVWLEDLDEFTRAERSLTPKLLSALTARRARTVVVATLRTEKYDELLAGGELARDIRSVFEQAERIKLEPTSADSVEQAVAARMYPSLDLTRYGLAEMLVGAPALLAHYRRARTAGRVSTSVAAFSTVVEVVIDWARIGRLDRMPQDRVLELAREVADTRFSAYDITEDDLITAVAAARLPYAGAGDTAALDTEWLTDPRMRGYRPFDYLVSADDIAGRQIPAAYWYRATVDAGDNILTQVGLGAYYRELFGVAESLFRRAADTGHTLAMNNLGALFEQRGEISEAEIWYRKAAEVGHTLAMNNLGALLLQRGETAEAEAFLRRAADTGHADAIYNLGTLFQQRGEITEAETWYRKAAEVGHTTAMNNLGTLFEQRGEISEAETWYRKAADVGHTLAIHNLGALH
ncbi:tetratricopeptide repeat protein [Nocardia sp. NPDC055165]